MDITVETIKRELPRLLREDPELRRYVLEIARGHFADRVQTDDRFDRVLDELRRDREEQARKWDEQNRKWDEQSREQRLNWDEQNRKWDEQNRKWDEQNRKWDQHQAEQREEFKRVHEEIMAQAQRHDRSIGALGSAIGE